MSGVGQLTEARGALIERPALVARVRQALDAGSLIVVAGPGFGKTTLLDQALDGRRVAWIGCTETDRDPGRLLARLIDGVSRAVPGAAEAFAERMLAAPDQVDAVAAAGQLLWELNELLVEPLSVVIDDAERIEGSAEALGVVSHVLHRGPPALRLAIASRRGLDIRVARMRAAGRLTELREADLAFTAEESAAALRGRRGNQPSDAELEEAFTVTEGWPLGIALLAGSPGGVRRWGREARASHAELHEYLAEEVLAALDDDLRGAAIDSSVARKLTPDVLDALGLPIGTLDRIREAGALARRAGGEKHVVAYHPLFRDFLLTRLDAERDEAYRRALHECVAPAVLASGDNAEAIEHWIEAERWDQVTSLLEQEGPVLVRSSPGLVREWLGRVPPDVRSEPGLQLLQGQLDWATGDHARATDVLWSAVDGLHARGDSAREWMGRLMLLDATGALGDVDRALRVAEGFDQPAGLEGGPFAAATAIHASVVLAGYGRVSESERMAERAQGHPGAGAITTLASIRLGMIDCPRGALDSAAERLREALRDAEARDPLNLRFYLMTALAKVLDESGRTDEAVSLLAAIEERSGQEFTPYMASESHDWRAKLHAQAGRLHDAEEQLTRGGPVEHGWRGQLHHIARACVAALRGDAGETSAAAERALALQPIAPPLVQFETAADLVPALAVTGRGGRAASVLEETMAVVDATFPAAAGLFPRAYLLALRAWLRHSEGDLRAADTDLAAMWAEARDARRFIVRREWRHLRPLLWSALERSLLEPAEAIEAIAAAFPDGAAVVDFTEHPVPEVRAAAVAPAIASGHAGAFRRLGVLAEDEDARVATVAGATIAALADFAPPLRFRLLGGFTASRGAWQVPDDEWDRPSAARLARYLLVHLGESVPQEAIIEALWPDLPPSKGRRSLQVAVSRARNVLDIGRGNGTTLESMDGCYRIRLAGGDTADAYEFDAAAATALSERGADRESLLVHARSLWGGEPLPAERYADWTIAWRERLTDRYVEVLSALARLFADRGEHGEAIGAARDLVDLDPMNEGAHRELMAAYARTGRTGHALRQYLECRRALVGELGVEPAEATSRLQAQILAGEAI